MDVGDWLRSLGLGEYEPVFLENKIDAEVLSDLTDGDLSQLGVPLGHRKRLLKAIAGLGATVSPAKPTSPTSAQWSPDAAERRPITVMFCDLVGSTSLAAKLDPEDWRNLVGELPRRRLGRRDFARRPRPEEARRRADGAVRLSARAGERRRARRARGARDPARARRTQRAQRRDRRAGARRPHRA